MTILKSNSSNNQIKFIITSNYPILIPIQSSKMK
jgi:hypothetical protein